MSAPEPRSDGERLQKVLAAAGVASRRVSEQLIAAGRVTVNGQVVDELGSRIDPAVDKVAVDGTAVQLDVDKRYVMLNKPTGVVSTMKDERGRPDLREFTADYEERLFNVGRLDAETSGLLVLTNDGALAERMMHPRHKMKKVYHITLDQPVTKAHMEAIGEGLDLEDGPAPVNWVQYLHPDKKKEVGLEIVMGRNRVVRRIFEHLGYTVKKLDRVYLGGLTKKDLPRGWWRHLNEREIIMLKHF
ncbi:MAG: rRNA pseudouridine synthase [Lewinella sp.]|nr:rRNA pseudouridine synthase [Lewinella sp.]